MDGLSGRRRRLRAATRSDERIDTMINDGTFRSLEPEVFVGWCYRRKDRVLDECPDSEVRRSCRTFRSELRNRRTLVPRFRSSQTDSRQSWCELRVRGTSTDGAPDALRGRRHVDMADAERRERVQDRVHDSLWRRARSRLPGAFDAERIAIRRDP